MNITKALEHFQYKFKNNWKPTQRDIEAYNAIVDFKQLQESETMFKNELFAKMFIHQLILLSNCNSYSGERSLQVIEEILSKSVYEWCKSLKEEIPMMRFRHAVIMGENDEKLLNEFKYTISEENIIKFVEKEVTRLINKYEK